MTEEQLQVQVASYLDMTGLPWIHVANEFTAHDARVTPTGKRWSPAVARLKRQGFKPGIPDVLIFEPFEDEDGQPYAGLAIELKVGGNYPTAAQREWAERLAACGWAVIPRATSLDQVVEAVTLCYPEHTAKVRI